MKALTINVDIDGVLGDFHEGMMPYIRERAKTPDITRFQWSTWNPAACFLIMDEDWSEIFRAAVMDRIFFTEKPIPGAIQGAHALLDAGHRVRIITSKILWDATTTARAEIDTLEWLFGHDLLHRVEVVFTGNTHHKTDYHADVVIDDQPNLGTWCQDHDALNIIYDQPWNQATTRNDLPFDAYLTRAQDWVEVVWAINGWASGEPH